VEQKIIGYPDCTEPQGATGFLNLFSNSSNHKHHEKSYECRGVLKPEVPPRDLRATRSYNTPVRPVAFLPRAIVGISLTDEGGSIHEAQRNDD
jgi:hypothetical protein